VIPDVPIQQIYTDSGSIKFDAIAGTDRYLILYKDYEPGASLAAKKRTLQSAAATAQIPGYKIVGTRQFALGGHPGIEIIYEPIIAGFSPAVSRLMIVGKRNYSIIAYAHPDNIQFFLTSFQPYF
jgi:hypothetical protein